MLGVAFMALVVPTACNSPVESSSQISVQLFAKTFIDAWAAHQQGEGIGSPVPVPSGRYTIRANIVVNSKPYVSNEISIAVVNPG